MPPPPRDEALAVEPAPLVDAIARVGRIGRSGRRARARLRRWSGRVLLLLPAAAIVTTDLALRHARLDALPPESHAAYAKSVLLGGLVWAGLAAVAARRRGAARWASGAALLALSLLAVGAQLYSYRLYASFLNDQSVLVGTSMLPSVGQQLWFDRATFARTLLPPVLFVLGLVWALRRWAPSRAHGARLGSDIAVLALVLTAFALPKAGEQDATFDTLYLHGMGQLLRARWDHNECVERVHPGPRSPLPLPALVATPAAPRDVLLVLTESVRATSTCVSYSPDCVYTPFSNAVVPDRIPFRQMRAVDSTTAISLAVMWSGLRPTESRAALHSAPLIFEYAHAASLDVAYWTSQNLLFGNSGTWLEGLPLDHHVSATELEEEPTMETGADDAKLVSHVVGELDTLREPFFGTVHLSNTHFPYAIDDDDAPFQPESGASGPGYEKEIRNRYQDAIYLQDKSVARLLTAVRASRFGARTVIVFLSDHGEQMREKGAVGHTSSLYDPEIRIPAWIDAPKGTLTAAEETHLRALTDTPLTSLDVMPTLLDLVGVWDAPGTSKVRAKMPGQSLLRGGSAAGGAVALTNCSELWACAFKNWGAMRGTKKLIATQVDRAWNCFDVATDPAEDHDLGVESCGDLRAIAEGSLGGRPF